MIDEKQPEKIPTGTCPICGKPAVTRHRPFCSHRCALIDLGRWLGGNYHVPAGGATEEDEDTPPGLDEDEG
ncbi:MAG TPA: DNA gyrase inhibitor YacG [Stellaceae bacterium]|jgi:hypothetical protein|nr:DNA gyrase inhibitor YacG [Stellaceae bacterium]